MAGFTFETGTDFWAIFFTYVFHFYWSEPIGKDVKRHWTVLAVVLVNSNKLEARACWVTAIDVRRNWMCFAYHRESDFESGASKQMLASMILGATLDLLHLGRKSRIHAFLVVLIRLIVLLKYHRNVTVWGGNVTIFFQNWKVHPQ